MTHKIKTKSHVPFHHHHLLGQQENFEESFFLSPT